jgi:L-ascorbate metabolism protein UlaG (beta-lactamase superfamily)
VLVPSKNLTESAGLRRERTLQCARFHSGRFHNNPAVTTRPLVQPRGMVSVSSEFFFGGAARRPPGALPLESPLEAWARPADSGLRVTWLGHSTTLVEIDGYRVLTDPVWSERISPVSFMGPRRFHAAPVEVARLPPLDAIVISHDHYDHLDLPSVRMLAELARRDSPAHPRPMFFTSLGVGERLERLGIDPSRVVELDWWESADVPESGLRLTAAPAHHFSGRSPLDRNRTAWSSWAMQTDRHRVFFSGDTGLTPDFVSIRERLGPFDLVMLEVGAYHPAWGDIHLGPDNALVAHEMLGGAVLLPVHWGTFDLALHAWDDPIETLTRRAGEKGARIVTPRLGRAIEPAQTEQVDPWWRAVSSSVAVGDLVRTS